MKAGRMRAALAMVTAWLALAGGGAAAEEPVETAIRAWVAAIDASPDWSAGYRDLTYDPASGSAALAGLWVLSARSGLAIDFDSVAVAGFTQTADGGFAARRVVANGGAIAAGIFKVALSGIVLDDFALPQGAGFVWDPGRPFTSMVKAYGSLAKVRLTSGRIGSVTLVEEVGGVASRISYDNIAVEGWADGKIALASAGPLTMDSPGQIPLITMSVARFEATGIDLGAFLRVYDPDNYAGRAGDRAWRTAVASTIYGDAVIDTPGAVLTVGTVAIGDFRVRQPETSFAGIFDAAMLDPLGAGGGDPAAAERRLDLASAFSLGRVVMSPLDIEAIGFDRLHLDRLAIADLSVDGLGEFALDGLEGVVAGQASLKVGRLALGGMKFPATRTMAMAMRTARFGGDVDLSSLAPTLGFIEAGGVDVDVAGIPRTRLGKMRVDLDNYVGGVPTSLTIDVADADFATSMIAEDRVRGLLETFGYQRVNVDSSVKVDWNEADDTTAVGDFSLAMADIGTLSGDATFAGPTRGDIEKVDTPGGVDGILAAVSLKNGTFTFKDDSLVGRAIAGQAARLKVDPDKFREQFARGLPFMLAFLGNRDFQSKVAPVLQSFIRTPGSITLMTAPAAPIAVSAIVAAIKASPFSLPNLLALTVSGETGAEAGAGAAGGDSDPTTETVR